MTDETPQTQGSKMRAIVAKKQIDATRLPANASADLRERAGKGKTKEHFASVREKINAKNEAAKAVRRKMVDRIFRWFIEEPYLPGELLDHYMEAHEDDDEAKEPTAEELFAEYYDLIKERYDEDVAENGSDGESERKAKEELGEFWDGLLHASVRAKKDEKDAEESRKKAMAEAVAAREAAELKAHAKKQAKATAKVTADWTKMTKPQLIEKIAEFFRKKGQRLTNLSLAKKAQLIETAKKFGVFE